MSRYRDDDPPDFGCDDAECQCGGFFTVVPTRCEHGQEYRHCFLCHIQGKPPSTLITFECEDCGSITTMDLAQEEPPDWEDNLPWNTEEADRHQACQHGEGGECDACHVLSDFAYDAWRERR
jgi:hypothetical protein